MYKVTQLRSRKLGFSLGVGKFQLLNHFTGRHQEGSQDLLAAHTSRRVCGIRPTRLLYTVWLLNLKPSRMQLGGEGKTCQQEASEAINAKKTVTSTLRE